VRYVVCVMPCLAISTEHRLVTNERANRQDHHIESTRPVYFLYDSGQSPSKCFSVITLSAAIFLSSQSDDVLVDYTITGCGDLISFSAPLAPRSPPASYMIHVPERQCTQGSPLNYPAQPI